MPVDRLGEFLDFFHREVAISPVWLCPLRQRDPDRTWDLYVMEPDVVCQRRLLVEVPIAAGAAEGDVNRAIEVEVARLHGRKSLYRRFTTRPTSSGTSTTVPPT